MKNILVTTLGTSPAIIVELFAFTNPADFPLYSDCAAAEKIASLRRKFAVCAVDEIWVITTRGTCGSQEVFSRLEAMNPKLVIRAWAPEGVDELNSFAQCRAMADLTFRVVMKAREYAAGGRLFLSLAGGRKTMSADMQEAAHFFGCHALIHVTSGFTPPDIDELFALKALNRNKIDQIHPIIISAEISFSPLVAIDPPLCPKDYPLPLGDCSGAVTVPPNIDLYLEVKRRVENSRDLLFNFVSHLLSDCGQTGFRALYSLPPEEIRRLHQMRLGCDGRTIQQEMRWLATIPKAELHCHLGGILSAAEMVEVARACLQDDALSSQVTTECRLWLQQLEVEIVNNNVDAIHRLAGSAKGLRRRFADISEPVVVASFIALFDGYEELLDRLIFADCLDDEAYCAMGIEHYETLGDLQGSGLLQCEAALRLACTVLKRQVKSENIIYLELRCSPVNYTRGGLTAEQVVMILLEELSSCEYCHFMLIFIASRHGDLDRIKQHIALATQLLVEIPLFRQHFAGFDLAGAESARNPAQLRHEFMPLLEQCINMTIHAGENESVQNIWEAVYHLSADRIGHGLTLAQNPQLMQRFIDRKITLEMCPSSNFQIVGYRNYLMPNTQHLPHYPLKDFLQAGLSVTVNTDNPGISRTTLSQEFYRAATLTEGGLSRWEILLLVRNAFRNTFCEFSRRRELIRMAEQNLISLLRQEVA